MFIQEYRREYPIEMMCRLLSVNRTKYYYWLKNKISIKQNEDIPMLEIIKFHYNRSKGTYGLPRIHAAIRKEGIKVNKKRIARLMKLNNIKAKTKRRFKVTTKQNAKNTASENLLKQNFNTDRANKIWTSDITYIWTKEGWLFLAIIMDIYSRKIVGWALDKNMQTELIVKALNMAVINRNPDKGIVFHSDRGAQYTSSKFRKTLEIFNFIQSMSSTGNCYDNAITESFFHTLKTELVYWENYTNREEAKRSIFEFIEINYNRVRMHSSLGYLSPVEFEEKNKIVLNAKVA